MKAVTAATPDWGNRLCGPGNTGAPCGSCRAERLRGRPVAVIVGVPAGVIRSGFAVLSGPDNSEFGGRRRSTDGDHGRLGMRTLVSAAALTILALAGGGAADAPKTAPVEDLLFPLPPEEVAAGKFE